MSTTIGFVGLGHMGGRMATRYIAAGYRVYGHTRNKERAGALLEDGVRWCETPRELAQSVEVIFTSIPDDDALADVASGDDGILAGLEAGKTWLAVRHVGPRARLEVTGRV